MTSLCRCLRWIGRGMALTWVAALVVLPAATMAAIDKTTAPATPASSTVDYDALVRELTLLRNVDGRMTMAFWMPEEFWRAALRNGGQMTDKSMAEYLAVIHPYTLVAVMDAQRGITSFHFTDTDTLTGEVMLEDAHGTTYSPLPPDSVAEDIRNLIQMLRPLLSSMMGAMGQHLEIFVFPSVGKAGNAIADPTKDGSLTAHVGDVALHYRLPLGSVLPPSLDPKTGESFPGSYHFNPYTGKKLVQSTSDKGAAITPKPQ